jgi:hypothetical protein
VVLLTGLMRETTDDPVLGKLVCDGFDYEGKVTFRDRVVRFTLSVHDEDRLEHRRELARRLARDLEALEDRVVAELAGAFESSDNEGMVEVWENGGSQLSCEEFGRRLSLAVVEVGYDNEVTLSFGEDGMFGEHSILVYLDEDLVFKDAQIAG